MKKILNLKNGLIIAILGIATFGGLKAYDQIATVSSVLLKNTEALANSGEINHECPNGCLTDLGYCFCYRPYPNREKNWVTK